MKKLISLFLFTLLLTGCGVQAGEPTLPAVAPPLPQTSEPASAPIEPSTEAPRRAEDLALEERVGQLFLARCPEENAPEDLQAYHLAGYLFFGRDFENETWDSMADKLSALRAAADIEPLFVVDEEGGTVCRVSLYSQFRQEPFASPRSLYRQGGLTAVLDTEFEKAVLLSALGLNVNMAPVCDMADEPRSFLYARSLGQNAQITGQFVSGTVGVYAENGIGAVLKHFPGYGNNADTHTGIAVDNRSLASLEERDLLPFQAGIQAGVGAILVSHTIVTAMDENYPASLSPEVHRYLRQEMGFDGVIMTDDLVMEAITDTYGAEEAAVLAVLAGNDLLCSTDYRTQYAAVLEAVQSGRIPESRLNEAVNHVLAWKASLGLYPPV